MRIKFEIDENTAQKLVEYATVERRPLPWQAEVLLMRALSLPPQPSVPDEVKTAKTDTDPHGD